MQYFLCRTGGIKSRSRTFFFSFLPEDMIIDLREAGGGREKKGEKGERGKRGTRLDWGSNP